MKELAAVLIAIIIGITVYMAINTSLKKILSIKLDDPLAQQLSATDNSAVQLDIVKHYYDKNNQKISPDTLK